MFRDEFVSRAEIRLGGLLKNNWLFHVHKSFIDLQFVLRLEQTNNQCPANEILQPTFCRKHEVITTWIQSLLSQSLPSKDFTGIKII